MNERIKVKGATGTVTFDGQVVNIRRSYVQSAGSPEDRAYPVSRIGSVDLSKAGVFKQGMLAVRPTGSTPPRFFKRRDPNAVVFNLGKNKQFAALRDAILAAM